jgi:hypothetical protein
MPVFLWEGDQPKELVGLFAPQWLLVGLTVSAHWWSPVDLLEREKAT